MSNYLDQLKDSFKKRQVENQISLLLEQATEDLHSKIFDFFRENPQPTDEEVHNLAEKLDIDADELESHVYMILGSILGAGKSKDFKGSYDPKELKMGIKVEMEHTTNPKISERIAKDHLAEIPDYYTRLLKMEKEAGVE